MFEMNMRVDLKFDGIVEDEKEVLKEVSKAVSNNTINYENEASIKRIKVTPTNTKIKTVKVIIDLIEDSNVLEEDDAEAIIASVNRLMLINGITVYDLNDWYVQDGHAADENGYAINMEHAKEKLWAENLKKF